MASEPTPETTVVLSAQNSRVLVQADPPAGVRPIYVVIYNSQFFAGTAENLKRLVPPPGSPVMIPKKLTVVDGPQDPSPRQSAIGFQDGGLLLLKPLHGDDRSIFFRMARESDVLEMRDVDPNFTLTITETGATLTPGTSVADATAQPNSKGLDF